MPDEINPGVEVARSEAVMPYKSRYGFHVCSYKTYKQLKTIRRVYELQLRQRGAHGRWSRKMPHNRVIRRKVRNEQNQVIGYEVVGAWHEPHVCPLSITARFVEYHKQAKRVFSEPMPPFLPLELADIEALFEACVEYEASRKKK